MNNKILQKRLCGVDGCGGNYYCNNFCQKHYSRVKRHGDPNITKFKEKCTVNGCDKKHYAKGLCQMHRMRGEYGKKFRNENAKKLYNNARKRLNNNPMYRIRINANNAVMRAKRKGVISIKPCEVCGAGKANAHHDSYEKESWLDVRWLCSFHHAEWHQKNTPKYPTTFS